MCAQMKFEQQVWVWHMHACIYTVLRKLMLTGVLPVAMCLQRKIYKDQAELMLTEHVFKEFQSPHGFLRARVSNWLPACLHCVGKKCNPCFVSIRCNNSLDENCEYVVIIVTV